MVIVRLSNVPNTEREREREREETYNSAKKIKNNFPSQKNKRKVVSCQKTKEPPQLPTWPAALKGLPTPPTKKKKKKRQQKNKKKTSTYMKKKKKTKKKKNIYYLNYIKINK